MPTIDFSAVKDFEPIPGGDYTAAITKHEFGTSKSGNQKVKVTYTIQDGEYEGRNIWKDYSLLPSAVWVIRKHLIAIGADPEDFGTDTDLDSLLDDAHDVNVTIVVGRREGEGEYAGKVSNELLDVKEINAVGAFR